MYNFPFVLNPREGREKGIRGKEKRKKEEQVEICFYMLVFAHSGNYAKPVRLINMIFFHMEGEKGKWGFLCYIGDKIWFEKGGGLKIWLRSNILRCYYYIAWKCFLRSEYIFMDCQFSILNITEKLQNYLCDFAISNLELLKLEKGKIV